MTDNNALAQLKPCPFCSGEALLENTITQASIMCCDCPCVMRRDHTTPSFDDGTHRVTAAWNTRTPAPAGEVGELRGKLQYAESTIRAYEKATGVQNHGPCPICGGVEGCPHSLAERITAAMLERLAGPVQQPASEGWTERGKEWLAAGCPPVQQAGQRPPALGGGMLKRIKDMSQQAGGDQIPRLPRDKLLYGSPDYIDDPEGLERWREMAKRGGGHDPAPINNNSFRRLLDTIERYRAAIAAMQPAPLDGEG